MNGDEMIKSTWTSIFSRKGGSDSSTRIWENRDDVSTSEAVRSINLQAEELPVVLASLRSAP
jgi:hypothetical protein